MLLAAARALADYVSMDQIEHSQIYPEAKELRSVSATVGPLIDCLDNVAICRTLAMQGWSSAM
jgi:malic enzyme